KAGTSRSPVSWGVRTSVSEAPATVASSKRKEPSASSTLIAAGATAAVPSGPSTDTVRRSLSPTRPLAGSIATRTATLDSPPSGDRLASPGATSVAGGGAFAALAVLALVRSATGGAPFAAGRAATAAAGAPLSGGGAASTEAPAKSPAA